MGLLCAPGACEELHHVENYGLDTRDASGQAWQGQSGIYPPRCLVESSLLDFHVSVVFRACHKLVDIQSALIIPLPVEQVELVGRDESNDRSHRGENDQNKPKAQYHEQYQITLSVMPVHCPCVDRFKNCKLILVNDTC
jgi:hypothetical protein